MQHEHRKIERTPEEIAKIKADRERYQREKPTPEQLLAEGGHKEFTTLGELLEEKAKARKHNDATGFCTDIS